MASLPPELMDPTATNTSGAIQDLHAVKIRSIWAAIRREPLSFWTINLYLFLEYVRPQTAYPAFNILPWDKVILITTLITLLGEQRAVRVRNIADKLMMFFLITILVSSVLAAYPGDSFLHLTNFTDWLVIYFLITRIVTTETRFFIFFLAFLAYNFKMSLHGFWTWAERGFAWENWGVTGAPGWFQNSGEFGIELCIFIPLCIYFITALWTNWGYLKRLFFLLFPITAMVSVAATSSRGAALGTAAAITFITIQSRHRIKAAIFAAVLLLTLYYLIPPESLARFHTAGTDQTSVDRLVRWKAAADMMERHPFFGIGYFNWERYYPRHYPTSTGGVGFPHNIFLDAGSQLGYTGLGLFVLLIIACFVNNHKTRTLVPKLQNPFLHNTALGLDAALIGLLISGSFISVLYYPYFWINLSFVVALRTVAEEHAARQTGPSTDVFSGSPESIVFAP
ncbi:MAG: O-antigen ligase family protein [Acidiferrobacterales bacterium]